MKAGKINLGHLQEFRISFQDNHWKTCCETVKKEEGSKKQNICGTGNAGNWHGEPTAAGNWKKNWNKKIVDGAYWES